MSNRNSIYHKSLQLLNEGQFNDFIKLYFKNHYRTTEVIITNGPYDGGLDLVYYINQYPVRNNIQITVQETDIRKKILSDAKKAKENVDKYEYLSTLLFYSKNDISNETKNKVVKEAKELYSIDVDIYDGKRLAALVEAYPSLQHFLGEQIKPHFRKERMEIDNNTKLVFDVLARQTDMTDIKQALIKSCFLSCLFQKGRALIGDIYVALDSIFCGKINHSYYEYLTGILVRDGEIIAEIDNNVKLYRLSADTYNVYEALEQQAVNCEIEVNNRLKQIAEKYGIICEPSEIVPLMNEIYDIVYKNGLSELNSESSVEHDQIPKRMIHDYIESRYKEIENTGSIADEIISAFEANDLWGKESLSRLFINLYNNDSLDQYLASTERMILLDTPVLIRWICLMINKVVEYKEPYYQAVKQLRDAVLENLPRIKVVTMAGYVTETVVLLRRAIRLSRFESIINQLGPSNNVFFNYYQESVRTSHYESCGDFVADSFAVEMDLSQMHDEELDTYLNRVITERLSDVGIIVKEGPYIESQDSLWRDFDYALYGTSGEKKSSFAKHNDLQTVMFMSDVYQPHQAPCLVTSDGSFTNVRKEFLKKYGETHNWLLFSPQNMARTISVERFKIDSKEVSNSIRLAINGAITENANRRGLIDAISDITSNWAAKDMKFANNIASLKKILQSTSIIDAEIDGNSIDEVLIDVLKHLQNKEESKEKLLLMVDDTIYRPKLQQILKRNLLSSRDRESNNELLREIDKLLDSVEVYED